MKFKSLLSLCALSFLVGCNSMKVTTEQNYDHDLTTVKTYQWVPGPADILDDVDTYINDKIKNSLNAQLRRRGLKQVSDPETADVQVAYYVKLKEQQEYASNARGDEPGFSGGLVYSRNTGSWDYQEREPDITVYAIEIGTLTVLLYDVETGDRIWKGDLKTRIDRSKSDETRMALINEASAKLIAHIPLEVR
jgi:hypothetical protein